MTIAVREVIGLNLLLNNVVIKTLKVVPTAAISDADIHRKSRLKVGATHNPAQLGLSFDSITFV